MGDSKLSSRRCSDGEPLMSSRESNDPGLRARCSSSPAPEPTESRSRDAVNGRACSGDVALAHSAAADGCLSLKKSCVRRLLGSGEGSGDMADRCRLGSGVQLALDPIEMRRGPRSQSSMDRCDDDDEATRACDESATVAAAPRTLLCASVAAPIADASGERARCVAAAMPARSGVRR